MRNILSNAALALASTLATLLIVEMAVSVFSPQKVLISAEPDLFFVRYDREIGWVNREGAEGVYRFSPFIHPVKVSINPLGFRGKAVPVAKPRGVRRVLFLGDSVAFGYGVREEERFSDMLEGRFLPDGFEVLNLSVLGYGTDQELILFERDGIRYQPDIVVLAFTAGDLSNNMYSISSGSGKPYFKTEGDRLALKNVPVPRGKMFRKSGSGRSVAGDFLYGHSHLYRLIFNRLVTSNVFIQNSVSEMSSDEGMQTTVRIIEGFAEICRKNGCGLMALLIPHGDWVAASSRSQGAEVGYFPVLKMQLAEKGINYLDATPALLKYHKSGEDIFLKNDPVHLSVRGNEAVAEAVYEGLKNKGFVASQDE